MTLSPEDNYKLNRRPDHDGQVYIASDKTIHVGTKNIWTTMSSKTDSGAPTTTPDFIGQIYIDSSTGAIYMASGTSGSYNWGYIGAGALSEDYRVGLVGCWDASNGPTPTTNATTLTGWNDTGSSLNHLALVYGNPLYYQNIQNGLPAVYFDGVNDELVGSNQGDIGQPTTHFLVFKPTDWGDATQEEPCNMYNASQLFSRNPNSSAINIYAGTNLGGPVLSNNTTSLVTAVFNGASSSVSKNADAATTGNAGTQTNTMYPVMGTRDGINYWYKGYIMEWRVYTGALTTAQQEQVQTFLNNKWGIY